MSNKEIHDIFMVQPMKNWPNKLQQIVQNNCKTHGFCGEVLSDAVKEYISENATESSFLAETWK